MAPATNRFIERRSIGLHLKEGDSLGSAPLTPTMVREAEVIELLASDVKKKMRLTINTD
jgi:hypothetical protein